MNELIHLRAGFVEKSIGEDETLTISGYASTVNKDRVGDVIQRDAWTKGGLANYLKNPIVLAYHDHKNPIGIMTQYSIDELGLKITAKISKAAGNIIDLIKDGVLQAFSVGVRVKEADYDSESDTFLIKDVELHEISVVSVPANQDSLFSIAKCFDTETDFAEFKQKYVKESGIPTEPVKLHEEIIMNEDQLKELIAATLSAEVTKQKALDDAKKAQAEAEAARQEELKKAVAEATAIAVSTVQSGAEKLVADLKKAQEESEIKFTEKLKSLQDEIVAKSEEISRITRASKVDFSDRMGAEKLDVKSVSEAAILGMICKMAPEETKLGKTILEKAAANASSSFKAPSDLWEQTLSNRLEEDVRLQLVVAPLFREIPMQSAKQIISINPDMGYADWVASSTYGNTTTTDPEVTKTLTELTLSTSKLAAKAYLTDETEEDAIIPVLPLIYEGLARAHARKVEWALLNNDVGSDTGESSKAFASGLVVRASGLSTAVAADGTASAKVIANGTSKFTAAHVLAARRKMGVYGYNVNELVGILSLDAWYDMMEDPEFANLNEVGGMAAKLTGEVGRMYGVRFIVSPEMPAEANGAAGIILVNARNYLMPRLRGYTVQTEYSVERQRRTLVATQRIGFSDIISTAKSVATVTYDADGT